MEGLTEIVYFFYNLYHSVSCFHFNLVHVEILPIVVFVIVIVIVFVRTVFHN